MNKADQKEPKSFHFYIFQGRASVPSCPCLRAPMMMTTTVRTMMILMTFLNVYMTSVVTRFLRSYNANLTVKDYGETDSLKIVTGVYGGDRQTCECLESLKMRKTRRTRMNTNEPLFLAASQLPRMFYTNRPHTSPH